jgi:hypothetical protein
MPSFWLNRYRMVLLHQVRAEMISGSRLPTGNRGRARHAHGMFRQSTWLRVDFHADVEAAVFARVAETHTVRLCLKSCSIVSTAAGLEYR